MHALVMLEKKKHVVTATRSTRIHPRRLAGSKKKRCNTELAADEKNAPLFKLIDQAEDWLDGHTITNPILKWDTKAWGEIPADFNRK